MFRFFRIRSATNVHSIEYSWIRSWRPVFVRVPRDNRGMPVALCEPTQTISRGLDIAREKLQALDDEGIAQALRGIEALSRKTYSVMLELVAELEARQIAGRSGFGSTARLLAGMLQQSAGEARTRVDHASLVGTRRTLTGDTLQPLLPATAAALASGQIGVGQLRMITETKAALPASVP
jgi:hypothetical protein